MPKIKTNIKLDGGKMLEAFIKMPYAKAWILALILLGMAYAPFLAGILKVLLGG